MKASTLLLAIAVAATLTAAAIVAADSVPAQVVRGSSGGWHATSAQQEFESPMCNIPRVSSSLSYDEFVREYQGRKPFVFTHTGPAVLKARTQLAKGLVLKRYSDVPVHLCNPEGAGPYRGCVLGKLGEWIEALQNNTVQAGARADEQHYLFNSKGQLEKNFPEMVQDLEVPPLLNRVHEPGSCVVESLCVGQPLVGLPFHWHVAVPGHETIWGRKRWLLSRDLPPTGFNPKQTSLDWIRDEYPKLLAGGLPDGFYDCTLGPGETLYIPAAMYHATLNVGEVVSVRYHCDAREQESGRRTQLGPDEYRFQASQLSTAAQRINLMQEALALYPGIAEFHYHLALVALGDSQDRARLRQAARHTHAALSLNALHPSYHALAARVAATVNDNDRAIGSLRTVLELDPNALHECVVLADTLAEARGGAAAIGQYLLCVEAAERIIDLQLNPTMVAEATVQLASAVRGLLQHYSWAGHRGLHQLPAGQLRQQVMLDFAAAASSSRASHGWRSIDTNILLGA